MIKEAEKFLGANAAVKQQLFDYYNNNCYPFVSPKRRYKMKKGDNWCAMFTTVIANRCGLNADKFPYEVSVFFQVKRARELGTFHTDLSQVQPHDLIIYDWDSNGVLDHVGIVVSKGNEAARLEWEQVARQVGDTDFRRDPLTGNYLHPGVAMGWSIHAKAKGYDYIRVIEGNKSDTVGYRTVNPRSAAVVGFIKTGYKGSQTEAQMPVLGERERIGLLAKRTMEGEFGNGEDMERNLGQDYQAVQAWINNHWH